MRPRTVSGTFYVIGTLFIALAAIGSFSAWTTSAVMAGIAGGLWSFLFAYMLAEGSIKPPWQMGTPSQRVVLIWSWFWTATAAAGIFFWWVNLTMQVAGGQVTTPKSPNVPFWFAYLYGFIVAAVLQFIGWLPKRIVLGKYTEKSSTKVPLNPAPADLANGLQTESQADNVVGISSVALGGPNDVGALQTADNGKPIGTKGADTLWLAGRVIFWCGVTAAAVLFVAIVAVAMADPSSAGLPGFLVLLLFAALCIGLGWVARYGLRGIALKRYRGAAEQGDARAQYKLGHLYDAGVGVPRSYPTAAQFYLEAAEQEIADAQYEVGVRYETGVGLPQDFANATEWHVRAAKQGDTRAQKSLAKMYVEGRCVPSDNETAAYWYQRLPKRKPTKRLVLEGVIFLILTPLGFLASLIFYLRTYISIGSFQHGTAVGLFFMGIFIAGTSIYFVLYYLTYLFIPENNFKLGVRISLAIFLIICIWLLRPPI